MHIPNGLLKTDAESNRFAGQVQHRLERCNFPAALARFQKLRDCIVLVATELAEHRKDTAFKRRFAFHQLSSKMATSSASKAPNETADVRNVRFTNF
jgi:hypothetical protein